MQAELVKEKQNILQENLNLVSEITQTILADYTSELDNYIEKIRHRWIAENQQPTDQELDDVITKIPLYLYSVSSILERLGIEEDMAKLNKNNKHNDAILLAIGTVVEKNAKADIAVAEDAVIHLAYTSAHNQMKQKFAIALELLNSAKKIQGKRVAEMQLRGGN